MNLSAGPHHNIYGWQTSLSCGSSSHERRSFSGSEAGYALVALLAVMSVLVLFAIAAAPSIRQQAQREQEKEAIFRGEQVAEAILSYYRYRRSTLGTASDAALATSMDQLLEGIPVPCGTRSENMPLLRSARHPPSF